MDQETFIKKTKKFTFNGIRFGGRSNTITSNNRKTGVNVVALVNRF